MTDRLLRPREVAAAYGLPRDAVYEALRSQRLKAIHRGTRYLCPAWAVEEWIRDMVRGDEDGTPSTPQEPRLLRQEGGARDGP